MTIQDATAPLRRVYVRAPVPADLEAWRTYGWREAPDASRAVQEHAAFRAVLEEGGAEVVVGGASTPGDPDAIYAYDPTLMTDLGAILLRPGKRGRRDEPAAAEMDLAAAGVPIRARMSEPATAECGDMFWLDARTLLVGVGYRTNPAAVEQLRAFLGSVVDVVVFDLPHFHGPEECLHLMSFVSPLAPDLAVAYLPMMPVRLLHLLRDHGIAIVEVPDEEFESMGPNVLALAPRRALTIEGNGETRRRMEAAGVEVRTYAGREISRKGDGGPTCLTKPLSRG
ncbi:MAG: arginine deiminase family protein [Actinomycetota bacterium]|nr:arginine deiminase family protein [Actinomycetota bacterium]